MNLGFLPIALSSEADTFVIGDAPGDPFNPFVPSYQGFQVFGLGGDDQLTFAGPLKMGMFFGGEGNDKLISSSTGTAVFLGEAGNDTLLGGAGNDTLNGGAGSDFMRGRNGADTFSFANLSDSKVSAAGRDTIFDFSHAQHDKMDLRSIDANSKVAGDQGFSFIGANGFHGKAGELQAKDFGADTLVSADVNGDARADFSVLVKGHVVFQADDFLL